MEARDREMEAINRKLDRILTLLGDNLESVDTDAPPKAKVSWRHVGLAYRARFLEAKRGEVLDYHIQRHQQHFEDVARIVSGYANPDAALTQALDNFFASKWAKERTFPPRALVTAFERFHTPPKPDDEPDAHAHNEKRLLERRREEARELQAKLNGEGAVKPPPLQELLAGIGRTF